MMHPSGNEDIPRSHWLRAFVLVGLLLLGLIVQAWLNLASIAASAYPGWGGSGILGMVAAAIARWGTVRHTGDLVRTAFLRGYLGGVIHNPFQRGLTRDQAYWLGQWQYAADHILGSPPLYMGIAWNLVVFVCVVLVGALLAANRLVSTRGVDARLGTSEWAAPRVLRPYLRAAGSTALSPLGIGPSPAPGALPLGRINRRRPGGGAEIALPLRDADHHIARFSHVALWGVPEAGKTSGVFKPWLLRDATLNDASARDRDGWPVGAMSSIAIDMKHPDLYPTLAGYIAPHPRRLLVLAPGHPETSLDYNPLDFITLGAEEGAASDIAVLADAIVMNTPLGYRDDVYYRSVETGFLELLMQFVLEARGHPGYREIAKRVQALVEPVVPPGMPMPGLCSFPMIGLLAGLPSAMLLQLISQTGALLSPDRPETWPMRITTFLQMNKRSDGIAGLLEGLKRRLAVFRQPEVARISTRSDFALDLLGRQPGTLIIGMPRLVTQASRAYSALLITQLLQQLKRLAARSPHHRLPVPVTVYLDELANQGRIPALEDEVATLRDLGVAFVLGLQNTAALEARYTREAATSMINNANTKIVFGRNLGLEDAEMFAKMAGETTLVTGRVSEGAMGTAHGAQTARRAFITPDQIRRMKEFEALVFLQSGHVVQTRLTPFHEMRRELARLPYDPSIVTGRTHREGFEIPPSYLLRLRQQELDRLLGPWDTRPAAPAPASAGGRVIDRRNAEAMAAFIGQARERERGDAPPDEPDGETGAGAGESEETGSASARTGEACDGSGAERTQDEAPAKLHKTPEELERAAAPTPAGSDGQSTGRTAAQPSSPVHTTIEPATLQDLTGFFRAVTLRGTVTSPEVQSGAPVGWRVALDDGAHLLVRWALLVGYADRRSLRATDLLARWQRAGLVRSERLRLTGPSDSIPLVAFTPLAVSRLIPAIADRVRTWPEAAPETLRDGSTRSLKGMSGAHPAPGNGQPQRAHPPRSAPRNDPEGALRAVISWARAHRAELSGSNREIGQWDGVTRDTPVLLIRSHHVMQMLGKQGYDAQGVLTSWRDTGIIITQPNRFTVQMRAGDSDEDASRNFRGAYFMAFVWSALQQAGLQR